MKIALTLEQQKLAQLCNHEGFDTLDDLLEAASLDSVSPAICVNEGCDYSTDMEPDQDAGHCEICGTQTVKSALILAGLI
jgi:hypothetical protein